MDETQAPLQTPKGFVTSRVFDAPRQRVWLALTEVEHLKQWWGSTGFSIFAAEMDLRPGGAFHCGMRSLEGYKLWAKFVYREVEPPRRLVFVNSFSNEAGGVTRHPIVPTWPLETLTTLTLDEEPGGKTTLAVRSSCHNATEVERKTFDASYAAIRATWAGTFDQLAAYLAKG